MLVPNGTDMPVFTRYQKFVVTILAFLQFTIVLDFMIIGPLGALLLSELDVSPRQFGLVVSSYAFSAGASGLLAASFADKFDRKRLLMFFYSGFVIGTFLCGVATGYWFLLAARIVTGLFGGVIGAISLAIVADLFALEVRGRAMGIVQTAFAASQVMGIPLGVFLSNLWGWHAPFLMIVLFSLIAGVVIVLKLEPIDAHLELQSKGNPRGHLFGVVSQSRYLRTFAATMLLATGGFMLVPFGSTFTVHNLGISLEQLPLIYMVTGVVTFVAGPFFGRLADRVGKYRVFAAASSAGMLIVVVYCHLGVTPLPGVMALNTALFLTINARMVSAMALTSAVPDMRDRGAFMAVNSSLQQFAGGVSSAAAGLIVTQTSSGRIEHYDVLGYVVALAMAVVMFLMYGIHVAVAQKTAQANP
jgi:predicted MFS family arabinose efflux permease